MLALAQHFGNSPIDDLRSGDSIYFDAPGLGLVRYPASWALPLTGIMALLFIASAAATKNAAMVPALSCWLLWLGVLWLHPQYHLILHGMPYNGNWYLLFFVATALGLFVMMHSQLKRWIRPLESSLAAMLAWLLLLGFISVSLPGVSFIFTWPLMAMLLALVFLLSKSGDKLSANARALILTAAAAPGVVLFAPLIHLLYNALTPDMVYVPMILLALFFGIIAVLLDSLTPRRAFLFAPILIALALLGVGAMTSDFDPAQPQPDNLFYIQSQKDDQAFWVSTDQQLDSWTKTFFSPDSKKQVANNLFGTTQQMFWLHPAPAMHYQAPVIQVLSDSVTASGASKSRHVVIEIRSPRQAPKIVIRIEGASVSKSSVQAHDFSADYHGNWELTVLGMQDAPVRLDLQLAPDTPFTVRVRDVSYGLPPTDFAPRPANMMSQPFRSSDTAQALSVLERK